MTKTPEAPGNLGELLDFPQERREEMLRAAVECYGEGLLEQTEEILAGLLALDPKEPQALKLLGSTLVLQGRDRDAEQVYERAVGADEGDPYSLVALGELKLKAFKLEEAVPLFEKLFKMDPNGVHPAANRGRELVQTYYDRISGEAG